MLQTNEQTFWLFVHLAFLFTWTALWYYLCRIAHVREIIVLLERGWRGTRAQWGFGHELAKIHSTRYFISLARNWSKRVIRLDIPQLELENIRVIFPNISKIPKKKASIFILGQIFEHVSRQMVDINGLDQSGCALVSMTPARVTVFVNKCWLWRDLIFQVSEHDIGRFIEEPKEKIPSEKQIKTGALRSTNIWGTNKSQKLEKWEF